MPLFNPKDEGNASNHFPCVGLLSVLIALLIANLLQTLSLINQRGNLSLMEQRAETVVPEARVLQSQIEPRLEVLSRDLVQMATTNDTARALVNQFGITWNPNAPPVATPTAPAPAA